jgi:hypothetical protein
MITTTVSKTEIDKVIAFAATAGGRHYIPLFRAIRDRRIAMMQVLRGTTLSMRELKTFTRRPLVLILGDDDHMATGPSCFPCVGTAKRWARSVLLHGTGGEPEHYEGAVQLAEQFGNCLLIETSSAQIDPWLEALKDAPKLKRGVVIWPPSGETHPVLPRGMVQ